MTTQRYADRILRLYIVPYIEAIDDSFLLMLNNRLYTTRFLENMLKMVYQACSPNLNPIKYLWNTFELCIGATQIPPLTVQDLKIAILDEQNGILRNVIEKNHRIHRNQVANSFSCELGTTHYI